MSKVAWIGLGVMGYPMAGHLKMRGHHDVVVFNRTRKRAEAWVAEFGGTAAHTPAAAARDADFAIEAIVERLEPKKECFAKLDRFCPPHAILATNSSTLMNSQIAPSTKRPEKCVNMHYFYPPLVMKLVEVVKGQWTTEETVEITAEVTRRSGREPVILRKELPGFLVNRILRALVREAYYCLEQGVASHADIDKAVELGLNHPLGPFKLGDLSGLDIGYNARLETYEVTKNEADRPPKELEKRVKRGDLGRKSGRGFFEYPDAR